MHATLIIAGALLAGASSALATNDIIRSTYRFWVRRRYVLDAITAERTHWMHAYDTARAKCDLDGSNDSFPMYLLQAVDSLSVDPDHYVDMFADDDDDDVPTVKCVCCGEYVSIDTTARTTHGPACVPCGIYLSEMF
jgi:hypothetical protein